MESEELTVKGMRALLGNGVGMWSHTFLSSLKTGDFNRSFPKEDTRMAIIKRKDAHVTVH